MTTYAAPPRSQAPPPTTPSPSPGRSWLLPCAAIVVAVLIGNILYLTGVFDPNPILQDSGVATNVVKGLLPGQNNIDPNIGFTSQALGHLAAMDWLHGKVPWWNPFEGLGAPLAGEMQSAAFFPLVMLDLLANGQVLFHLSLELIAGISAFFLLRRLVKSPVAATVGSIAFALNGTFAWLFHGPGNPIAFTPLLLLGIEQCAERRTKTGAGRGLASGWPLVAIALALSVYAGFPEVAFFDGLLALVWAAVRASELRGRDLIGFVKRLAAGGLAGLGLSAPLLVAFVTYLQSADIGGHAHQYARDFLIPGLIYPAFVMPYVLGPVFAWANPAYDHIERFLIFWGNVGGYAGIAVTLLALVGLTSRPERRIKIALAVFVLIGLFRTTGVGPVMDFVNYIPGVSSTAFYRNAPASWTLPMAALAAFGVDELIAKRHRIKTLLIALAGTLIIAAAGHQAFIELKFVAGAPHNQAWAWASIAWSAGVVAVIAFASALRSPRARAVLLAGMLCTDVVAMFVTPQLSAPRSAKVDAAAINFLQAHLGDYRFYTLGPIQPNYGSYWQLSELDVNDLPVPKAFSTYITTKLDQNANPLIFAGNPASPSGPTAMQEFATNFPVYEAAGVKYLVVPSGAALAKLPASERLVRVYSDPVVQVYRLPHPAALVSSPTPGCSVASYTLSSAKVSCSTPGVIIRRELSMPGWSASVSGRSTTVGTYEKVFQAVAVPAGVSTVTFSFAPPHTNIALAAFVLAVLALLATVVRRRLRPSVARSERAGHGSHFGPAIRPRAARHARSPRRSPGT